MSTQRTGRAESPADEWNAYVLRFLMHHGQESQRHARRLAALESVVLRLCEDAPPTASFALHKAASDLRAEAQRYAAETQDSVKKVEELAAMAYRFLSQQDGPTRPESRPEPAPPAGRAQAKRPAPMKKKAPKKTSKKKC
ncbi:MAG: hypothetical protein NTY59_06300 [Alphaproteobacteria bacterium]|nr:hypothetical protein [Alphaproteobacteria bacterium]